MLKGRCVRRIGICCVDNLHLVCRNSGVVHVKYRALADFAFVKDLTRHLPGKLLRDVQPQTGALRRELAAVFDLREPAKDLIFHPIRNTTPIAVSYTHLTLPTSDLV